MPSLSKLGPDEFDVFNTETDDVQIQRAFELWWRKQTGRPAIVIQGFEYKASLKYGEG